MASPRRALAPLDANKPSPSPLRTKLGGSPTKALADSPIKKTLAGSPLSKAPVLSRPLAQPSERKRALEAEERVVKRSCVEAPHRASDASDNTRTSVFDADAQSFGTTRTTVSDVDTTQSVFEDTTRSVVEDSTRGTSVDADRTTIDVDRHRAQARKMANDLLARLRLAKYKVRTNQTHVPFPQLEARFEAPSPSPTRSDEGGPAAGLLSLSQGR